MYYIFHVKQGFLSQILCLTPLSFLVLCQFCVPLERANKPKMNQPRLARLHSPPVRYDPCLIPDISPQLHRSHGQKRLRSAAGLMGFNAEAAWSVSAWFGLVFVSFPRPWTESHTCIWVLCLQAIFWRNSLFREIASFIHLSQKQQAVVATAAAVC